TAFAATQLLRALVEILHGDTTLAAVATLTVALTPPVLSHAFLVFPETLAFAIVCWVVRVSLADERTLTVRAMATAAAMLGLMPWLHRKYAIFVIALGIAVIVMRADWFRRQSRNTLIALGALFLVPHIAFHVMTL